MRKTQGRCPLTHQRILLWKPVYVFFILLLFLPFLTSCDWANGEDPLDDYDHLYILDINITPPRLIIKKSEYVDLNQKFKTVAIYNNNHTVKEVKINVWEKKSGIGSVVYNEFRNYGATGEIRIIGKYFGEDKNYEKEVTIIVEDEDQLPDYFADSIDNNLKFKKIDRGYYYMGATNDNEAADDEKPYHQIFLELYYISEGEVTRDSFVNFLNNTHMQSEDLIDTKNAGLIWNNENYEVSLLEGNFPITHVTYKGAEEFCKWLGTNYRLPTEAEWETAARGGKTSKYPYGDSFDSTMSQVNKEQTIQVKSYPFNDYRLFDMMGNVREICSDWYGASYYYSTPVYMPKGVFIDSFKVLRGGSYLKKYGVRVSERDKFTPTDKLPDVGFRVVYIP